MMAYGGVPDSLVDMVETKAVPPDAQPATARTLGLPQATALILGSIVGVGIFNLPYSLAGIGPISIVALVIMATVGLLFISTANYTPWNVSEQSNLSAIGSAMAICLFSYLGVETAAVAAAKVRDPERNIPRATVFGTLASAAVYLLSM